MASNNTVDVIIIGGGVAGLSTAMQLAQRGSRVIVIERERLANGSTGRAAGLLGQLRGTEAHTRMLMDGVEIVRELEERADVEIFVQTGSLRVAATPERAQEIKDLVAMGKSINFEIDHIAQDEVATKLPYMKTDDLIDACYCPTDGHLQPAELASAYLKVGKSAGVEYLQNCPVEKVLIDHGKAQGVETAAGTFYAPAIVNAAGPWSYLVAELAETVLPTAAIGHYYLTTRPDEQNPVDRLSPAIRDRQQRIYSRPESGGLIVGLYGEEAIQYDMSQLPVDFDMSSLKARQDDIHVALLIHATQQRFPWINERTPMTITAGIMTFTPDGKPFCGKMPDVEGLYHCSGFSGHGIVQSPTIGVIMADLVLTGQTDYDIEAIEADRYHDIAGFEQRSDIKAKCYQMHADYYGRVEGSSHE
jgi:glycine/D-amino acid oxidase-like deaminating enzyme